MSKLLGALIKQYRLVKGIEQKDVAKSLGWKDESLLSRYERGQLKPSKAMIKRLAQAIGLTDAELKQLYYIGGFLPDEKEIKEMWQKLGPYIEKMPYPIYVEDQAWRVLRGNNLAKKFFNISEAQYQFLIKTKPTLVEIYYNQPEGLTEIMQVLDKNNPLHFKFIYTYWYKNLLWIEESWYKKILERILSIPAAKKAWRGIEKSKPEIGLSDYEQWAVVKRNGNKKELIKFHVIENHPIYDPRFEITMWLPMDSKAERYLEEIKRN